MASMFPGGPSSREAPEQNLKISQEKLEEGGRWYLSKKEIEENSPSRLDGISLKKETSLRKSCGMFLQKLGEDLKVPSVFCHRFFLRQSHAKNDWTIITITCTFLEVKVEETPRFLKDVILVSYKIIYQNDAAAVQRIRQKEVYEQKKELVLLGERVVLVTLGFDLNVRHPYGPLVEALKKFKVAQKALAQVAWSFVNDGLKTSLCLQFQPRQIAAGALFLAAMRLKIKLPTNGKNAWWQEFGITLHQLEDYCNQMLHLYEHNTPAFQASGAGGRNAGGRGPPSRAPANVQNVTNYSSSHGGATLKASSLKPAPLRPGPDEQRTGNHTGPPRITQTRNDEYGSSDSIPGPWREDGIGDLQRHEREVIPPQGNSGETRNKTEFGIGGHGKDHQEGNCVRIEPMNAEELKDKYHGRNLSDKDAKVGQSPQVAIIKLDREKLKAAFARRKARGDITSKIDPMDELERELEDVEVLGDRRLRAK